MSSMQKTLEAAVLAASVEQGDRRVLPCARALDLARQHDVRGKDIGDACNRLEVRIISCQLGCFP